MFGRRDPSPELALAMEALTVGVAYSLQAICAGLLEGGYVGRGQLAAAFAAAAAGAEAEAVERGKDALSWGYVPTLLAQAFSRPRPGERDLRVVERDR